MGKKEGKREAMVNALNLFLIFVKGKEFLLGKSCSKACYSDDFWDDL